MNRLLAGALIREAASGTRVAVLTGGAREAHSFFTSVQNELVEFASGREGLEIEVEPATGREAVTFSDAGSIVFWVAFRHVPSEVDLLYIDRASVEYAVGDSSEFDRLMRDLERDLPFAEYVYSEDP